MNPYLTSTTTMKIRSLLAGLLPLVLLAACGGDKAPAARTPNNDKATTLTGGASGDGVAAGKVAAKQTPKPTKRVRRPRVDFRMIKVLLGNYPPAPKAPVAATPELIALGKALYHTEAISQKGNLSCASCHSLSTYGVDNKPTSPGSTGENGVRNTPTTYNAFRNFRQFWDGRAASVEEQAIMPVINPIEHGLADEAAVLAKIGGQTDLVEGFKKAFPDDDAPINAKNFGYAIGAFERTLVTRSKWDDYIEGNQKAFSNEELLGLKTFTDVGCNQCHLTRMLGGNAYQTLGLRVPYVGKDTGRMQVTGSAADKYSFKVPSLLNVEMTAPYYHDGSIATLEDSVKAMAKNQLALDLSEEQVANIVVFLKTLTGKLPEEFVTKK